jgi:transcriptional regulator with XRE-family HTH domain
MPIERDALTDAMGAQLAERLRKSRAARGWTAQELADQSAVSRQQIYNIEGGRGGNTGITTIKRLADALGVAAGYLAFGG